MLVLIDESGCPGFKLEKGSTPCFALAMVIFNDFTAAEQASLSIKQLREELGVKPEFKFNKSSNDVRDAFFQNTHYFNFSVKALVVKKQIIYSPILRQKKENFYNYFIRNLLDHDNNILVNAIVKIDGSGNKELQRAMLSYLRSYIGSGKVNKFKIVDSKKDNLIQLADMTVGAIARSYNENRNDNNRWLNMLKKQGRICERDIWLFK